MPRKKKAAAKKQGAATQRPDADVPAATPVHDNADAEWAIHPARNVIKAAFYANEIPLDWKTPRDVYDHFADHPAFAGMPYDGHFTRRLRYLRDIIRAKKDAVVMDKIAYDIFRQNFPVREVNDIGLLRWHGSLAEHYLKLDMKAGLHLGKTPQEFRDTRDEYKLFSKKRFRKHINQEKRLWKLLNYLEDEERKKAEAAAKKRAIAAKKKAAAAKKKAAAEAKAAAEGKKKKGHSGKKKTKTSDSENDDLDEHDETTSDEDD